MPMPLLPVVLAAASLAPTPSPLLLGQRDGLDVVLFPGSTPHIARVLPAVVVVLEAGAPVPAELRARGTLLGGRSWRLPAANAVAVAADWSKRPGVVAAEPDMLQPQQRRDFNDPGHGGQWYLERLGMDELYAYSLGSPETRVAIIDSGIDINHPDLIDAIDAPYDAVSDDNDPSPNPGDFCPQASLGICDEHGTAVSGIVGARANNNVGIVGLCPQCTLIPIRLISDGETPISADLHAFEHAIAEDAGVINNSWGYTEPMAVPQTLAAVIHRAATETRGGLGAVVVFAAGNDDRELGDDELEALPDVVCVSAADSYGRPTAYTNRGATVDVCAPSATVTLAPGGGMLETFGGTSAAAPVVSGLCGWALSVAPELSAAELRTALIETAVQSPLITPDANGHHDVYGFGMISPHALLARLVPEAITPDAGPPDAAPLPADAALVVDAAAPDAEVDAAVALDDGPMMADAGPGTDATIATPKKGGGGCQVGPGSAPAGWGILAALAVLGLRLGRRRSRR